MIDSMVHLASRTSAQPKLWLLLSMLMLGITAPVQAQPYPGPESANSGMLQPSDQSGEVAALQRRLADLGYYSGPVTGYFDPATQAAVTQFQQSNGLTADGIVGAATSNALYQAGPAANIPAESGSPYLQPSADGADVSALQQQLSQLGYYTGSATGVFDEQTQAAVMNFQRTHGLAMDGIVGPATQAALYQTSSQTSSTSATSAAATTPEGQAATTTPAYTATATPDDGFLQLGDVGSEVSTLQTQLQALGYYDGPISGSFGSQTQSALIAFQQAQGLTADGIAGPQVNTALSSVTPATVTPAATQTAAVTVPPATTQPASQPAFGQTNQPASTAIAVPPASTIQPVVQPTQPVTQPTNATVQVPAIAPSIPASNPSFAQSATPANQPIPNEADRFSVMQLQRLLQLRGFDPVEMTGVYDSETQNAINQAQQAYGLSQGDLFEHY